MEWSWWYLIVVPIAYLIWGFACAFMDFVEKGYKTNLGKFIFLIFKGPIDLFKFPCRY